jgi:hypothetical protein
MGGEAGQPLDDGERTEVVAVEERMAGVRVHLDVVRDAEVGQCLQDQPVAGRRVADVG